MNAIISTVVIAIFVLAFALVAYIAPKVVDFVKGFIKWNFRR